MQSVLSRPVNQRGYIGVIAKVVESIPARLFLSRGIRTRGLCGYQRRDNQVRFCAGENPAGILRQMRVNVDLRKHAIDNANAFPMLAIDPSRAASADETLFSRGTLAVVTYRGYLRPLLPTSRGAPVVVRIALGASWMAAVIAGDDSRKDRAARFGRSHGRG